MLGVRASLFPGGPCVEPVCSGVIWIDLGFLSVCLTFSIAFRECAFVALLIPINWRRTTSIIRQRQSSRAKQRKVKFNASPCRGRRRTGAAGCGLAPSPGSPRAAVTEPTPHPHHRSPLLILKTETPSSSSPSCPWTPSGRGAAGLAGLSRHD